MTTASPPSCKLVILGDSSVGKTSLIHRFSSNKFNEFTANTIGAAFVTKEYCSTRKPDRKVKFEIWDTAGQERYRSLTPMYYRNARIALICFDLSNFLETFERAKYWKNQLELNFEENEINIKLIGTKNDLDSNFDYTIFREEAGDEAPVYRTSAKTGEGVYELFNDITDDLGDAFFEDYKNKLQNMNGERVGDTISILRPTNSMSSNCC